MIPPDPEIYEVEKRIAERRHRVNAAVHQAGRQTLRALTSPWALAGAAALGFIAAGGARRKHEHGHAVSQETKEKAKGGAVASLAMAAATWFIKAQFGSPVAMAQYFLAKLKKAEVPQAPSPRSDRMPATTRR
jgi:hypothetical protein